MTPAGIPRGLSRLIGRDADVDALRKLVRESRLVTLTGAGGSGKTRLAAEVAAAVAGEFSDGVAWVELAPLADPELLPVYVIDALGLEHGARPPLATLLESLRDREMLLVLDNCEHLVQACAVLADRLVILDRGEVVGVIGRGEQTLAELTRYLIDLQSARERTVA